MAHKENDSFPVLQLPLTMKDMVLPKLSVLDLYNLSHVSDEAKDWVKYYVRNKNYRLKITAEQNYKVSLLNSDNQGFDVTFSSFYSDENVEFYYGNFPVLTEMQVIAPNRMKILVLSQKLDAQWDQNEAMKSFIAHLSDVFTKDVCIDIGWDGKTKENILIDLVKDQNLNLHCFRSRTKSSLARIEELPNCKRLCIEDGDINSCQMKWLFDEWMRNGTMDYFEVTILPDYFELTNLSKKFDINYVMRDHEYTTSKGFHVRIRNYSVTRADGAAATVTFTPKHTAFCPALRPALNRGQFPYHVHPKFVIKCQPDQKYSTCFDA